MIIGEMMKGLIVFFACILASLWQTSVVKVLYDWFLLSITAVALTYWQFYGILLFWSVFSYRYIHVDSEDDEVLAKLLVEIFLYPLMMLFIGYVVKTFLI